MNFKEDELMATNNDFVTIDDATSESSIEGMNRGKFDKNTYGVDDVMENVEKIDSKLLLISKVIKGMDKRMTFNMRLVNLL